MGLEQQKIQSFPPNLLNYRDGMYFLNIKVEGKRSRALKIMITKAAGASVPKR